MHMRLPTRSYPIYNLTPPAGMYGHVEPVIGIQSNHPLNDTTLYDDDVAVHFTDGGTNTVYRTISTLVGHWAGMGHPANCGAYSYCIGPYSFGWAVKGFNETSASTSKTGLPAYLHVQPSQSEPDTRSGQKPEPLTGTLTVTGLTDSTAYEIYRWDSVDEAFTYADEYKKATFTATGDTHVYTDTTTFESSGTTYYRCVEAE
jgi:hypothetical protein